MRILAVVLYEVAKSKGKEVAIGFCANEIVRLRFIFKNLY